jgi:uncharacterized membrane protein YsdA (DUF1294 family)
MSVIKIIISDGGFLYFFAVSFIAVCLTVYDKLSAKARGRRVPEATLLLFSLLGGSAAMLITMLLIRHKTRHIKFMAGIPFIMAIQTVFIFMLYRYY